MSRQIIFREGVLYDDQWNAITPTSDELLAISMAVFKYTEINAGNAVKQPFSQQGCIKKV